jgi:hypothetical protein
MATKNFSALEGDRWPAADLNNHTHLNAIAQLKPDPKEVEPFLNDLGISEWQKRTTEYVRRMDDLSTDVLDIISATWLKDVRGVATHEPRPAPPGNGKAKWTNIIDGCIDSLPIYALPRIYPYRSNIVTLQIGLMPEAAGGKKAAQDGVALLLSDLLRQGHRHPEIRPKTSPPER